MSDVKPASVPWLSYAKKAAVALFAGATGVLGVLVVAVTASSDGGTSVTTPEWLQAAIVGLTAIGGSLGVYYATNQPRQVAVRRDEGGYAGDPVRLLITLLIVVAVIILIVWLLRAVLFAA